MASFERHGRALLSNLRTSVIHNDANDFNIIVTAADRDDPVRRRLVHGMVDFGNVVHSYTVGEVAVAVGYAMLHTRDPLTAATNVVAGYHAAFPMTDDEIEAVFPLACLRLCMSVALAAHQRAQQPDNAYLSVSEAPVWSVLEQLEHVHPDLAHYRLRDACGLVPCPATDRVTRWLTALGDAIGPVLDPDPRHAKRYTIDLSVGSLEWSAIQGRDDAATWSDAIEARLHAVDASIGVGRYDEARFCYTAPQFRVPSDTGDDWRTVHLGVDLFASPGTPVLAPLDGVVAAVRDNRGHRDYGPTVILRHDLSGTGMGSSGRFYTLYGHLDRDSLTECVPGQRVGRGDRIGAIGAPPDNGDWPPISTYKSSSTPSARMAISPGWRARSNAPFGYRSRPTRISFSVFRKAAAPRPAPQPVRSARRVGTRLDHPSVSRTGRRSPSYAGGCSTSTTPMGRPIWTWSTMSPMSGTAIRASSMPCIARARC